MAVPVTIRFYVNGALRSGKLNHIPLLFPFWGAIEKQKNPYISAALRQYGFDPAYYEITDDSKRADFVLLPYDYWDLVHHEPELLRQLISQAHNHRKPLLLYTYGDIEKKITVPDSYILRTGQYRFRLQSNEIIMPAYTEDLLESYGGGTLQLRSKGERASVGFTGWAALPRVQQLKTMAKELPLTARSLYDRRYGALKKGVRFRGRALRALAAHPGVAAHFNIKHSFSGHTHTIQGDVNEVRREFVENLRNADYALCVKGDGNFSNRFYEALSLGRIPLFVDTECALPLEDRIDYRKFCVFVDFRDIGTIGGRLSDFHASITNEEFMAMQRQARSAFANYLRTDVFTKHLMQTLRGIADAFYT